jgi:hypothetical protein
MINDNITFTQYDVGNKTFVDYDLCGYTGTLEIPDNLTYTGIINRVADYLWENKLRTEEYVRYCLTYITNTNPATVTKTVKTDIEGEPAGYQWDCSDNIYVYDNESVLRKRTIVWMYYCLTSQQLQSVVDLYQDRDPIYEEITNTQDKLQKILKIIRYGLDLNSLYEWIYTTIDSKILLKLKV